MTKDFRHILREQTCRHHDHLDAQISTLQLTDAEDLGRFFRIHLSCFDMIASFYADSGLDKMRERLRADLEQLALPTHVFQIASMQQADPLAVRYILAGSRMGTKVLRREWAKSDDPVVQAASSYFCAPADAQEWPKVCKALSAVVAPSQRAQAIISDVCVIFDCFAEAFARSEIDTINRSTSPSCVALPR